MEFLPLETEYQLIHMRRLQLRMDRSMLVNTLLGLQIQTSGAKVCLRWNLPSLNKEVALPLTEGKVSTAP